MEEGAIDCKKGKYEEEGADVDMGSRIEGKPLFAPGPIWALFIGGGGG